MEVWEKAICSDEECRLELSKSYDGKQRVRDICKHTKDNHFHLCDAARLPTKYCVHIVVTFLQQVR